MSLQHAYDVLAQRPGPLKVAQTSPPPEVLSALKERIGTLRKRCDSVRTAMNQVFGTIASGEDKAAARERFLRETAREFRLRGRKETAAFFGSLAQDHDLERARYAGYRKILQRQQSAVEKAYALLHALEAPDVKEPRSLSAAFAQLSVREDRTPFTAAEKKSIVLLFDAVSGVLVDLDLLAVDVQSVSAVLKQRIRKTAEQP